MAGIYGVTVDTVALATQWTEQRATYNLGHHNLFVQIKEIENALPFPLLGLDCDNGGELINKNIYRYLVLPLALSNAMILPTPLTTESLNQNLPRLNPKTVSQRTL